MKFDNLCNSCTNIGCEFQSGIVRTECAFYMPPHIEPDNCGNYVVMQPIAEYQSILDKIRAEIETLDYLNIEDGSDGYDKYIEQYEVLKIIDKYKAERGMK